MARKTKTKLVHKTQIIQNGVIFWSRDYTGRIVYARQLEPSEHLDRLNKDPLSTPIMVGYEGNTEIDLTDLLDEYEKVKTQLQSYKDREIGLVKELYDDLYVRVRRLEDNKLIRFILKRIGH